MNVEIYSKQNCPSCDAAKELLKQKGISFTEKATEIAVNYNELRERYPEVRQMPQIWINGQRVGGFDGLKAALVMLRL